MLYAQAAWGGRITAFPEAKAICPECEVAAIPKCGPIKSWHFAHASNPCDSWSDDLGCCGWLAPIDIEFVKKRLGV